MRAITSFNDQDVLCGRGGGTLRHLGNKKYRSMIKSSKPVYLMSSKNEKTAISRSIVATIRQNNGRFLERSKKHGILVRHRRRQGNRENVSGTPRGATETPKENDWSRNHHEQLSFGFHRTSNLISSDGLGLADRSKSSLRRWLVFLCQQKWYQSNARTTETAGGIRASHARRYPTKTNPGLTRNRQLPIPSHRLSWKHKRLSFREVHESTRHASNHSSKPNTTTNQPKTTETNEQWGGLPFLRWYICNRHDAKRRRSRQHDGRRWLRR